VTNTTSKSGAYFGNSSTVSFETQVHRILASAEGSIRPSGEYSDVRPTPLRSVIFHPPRFLIANRRSAGAWRSEIVVEDYVLPPRREADQMMKRFWKRVYPLFPFLDRVSFDRWYQDLWKSEDELYLLQNRREPDSERRQYNDPRASPHIPESRILHCILNIVFALSCNDDKHHGQNGNGDLYWQRCKRLLQLDFDIFNQGCLQLVQAMLLASLYLQSTELTGACWNLVGVAIRIAQGIGLHSLPAPCWDHTNRDYQESIDTMSEHTLRWRVWSGCVLMDRQGALKMRRL